MRWRPRRTVGKIAVAAGALVLAWAVWVALSLLFLPSVKPLKDARKSFVIVVKDWHRKEHPFVVGPKNRYWTPIGAVPAALRKAVIASEDANFYSHEGVDYEAIREAIKADIKKGRFAHGGSTITQQLAKNLYLSREKTLTRKAKEFVLARRIDDTLGKSRILELYLNVVELGPMVYGVGHASQYYFGKSPSSLTVRECAFLASMLPGPKVYDPYRKLGRVVRRSDRILRRMVAAGMIDEDQYRAALAEEPNIAGMERKVERTIAAPPPEEKPPATAAEEGLEVVEPAGGPGGEPPAVPEEAAPDAAPPGVGPERPALTAPPSAGSPDSP